MTNFFDRYQLPPGRAICYSGFREGQQPGGQYPSYEEVKEDLLLLHGRWQYLRLYDVDAHAQTVIDVIKNENLDFRLMLGAYIEAERNNFGCPWGGGVYSEEQLDKNIISNQEKIDRLIELANKYPGIICCLSVGNEACVDWTDHYVPVQQVIRYAQDVKAHCEQPVTFCENYVPWLNQLEPLAQVLDLISIHTYPVWEYKHIHEAIEYSRQNYEAVAAKYPDKPVLITEAGWSTQSNGRGINPELVSEAYQKMYFEDLMQWTDEARIATFYFEAFDESWKGSPDPLEPEKHWGLYHIDRSPKLAMKNE